MSDIHEAVRNHYGSIARSVTSEPQVSCCGGATDSSCGCDSSAALYSPELLEGLPIDVTGLSLGCGESQFA